MKDTQKKPKDTDKEKAAEIYPGVAVDIADDEKVSACEVRQQSFLLNDNPQTDGE